MTFYPLAESLNAAEREHLCLQPGEGFHLAGIGSGCRKVMAVRNGIAARPPRKGEWFISGAVAEAYRASNDMTTAYYPVRLVRVRSETKIHVDHNFPPFS